MAQLHNFSNRAPCIGCHTNCCMDFVVYVNSHDIHRISTNLKVPPESFIQLYQPEDEDSAVRVEDGLYDLALKDDKGTCNFLKREAGQFRCSIQPFKPGICRTYPFEVRRGRFVQIVKKVCPVDWRLPKNLEMQMSSMYDEHDKEWDFYLDLIEEWNEGKKDRSLSSFTNFANSRVEISLQNSA